MKIYVINLDRRPDRLERMQAIADSLGFEFERVSALDAKSDDFHHPNAPAQVCPPR
jgi:GR25 family glycosyltransferase involved in LPS biosynthesis